jgi:hypothetical protein
MALGALTRGAGTALSVRAGAGRGTLMRAGVGGFSRTRVMGAR